MEKAVTDFPHPDYPTSPRVSPSSIFNDRSLTARIFISVKGKVIFKLVIFNKEFMAGPVN